MKRKHKIALIALLPVLVLAGLAVWQRNNWQALQQATQYSRQELEEQIASNEQAVQETLQSMPEVQIQVREHLTEEERAALRDGTLSVEEAAERLIQPDSAESSTAAEEPSTATTKTTTTTTTPAVLSSYEQRLSRVVAKVYVLREQYTQALEDMEDEAYADYCALSERGAGKTAKVKLAKSYLTKATTLEKECDAQMDAVVKELEELVLSYGGDYSIVETVIETYANEKSLKKAWYISRLEEKGLM